MEADPPSPLICVAIAYAVAAGNCRAEAERRPRLAARLRRTAADHAESARRCLGAFTAAER